MSNRLSNRSGIPFEMCKICIALQALAGLWLVFMLPIAVLAQSGGKSVLIGAQSKADQPGKAQEAASLVTYLEDQIEKQLMSQYPCSKIMDDKGMRAMLQLEKDRELLGSDTSGELTAIAGAAGARYLVVATVNQSASSDYMQLTLLDGNTGKAVEKADKNTGTGEAALDGAEALATSFANSLNGTLGTSSKSPQNGDKLMKGTPIQLKCSCEGNGCRLWPLPDNGFPEGFVFAKKTVTSSLVGGEMVDGVWDEGSIIVGTAVTEEWEGGRCVKVDTGGVQTNEPAPTVFKISDPGTYILRVRTDDYANRADCNGSPPCSAGTPLRGSTTTVETKFTVAGCSGH